MFRLQGAQVTAWSPSAGRPMGGLDVNIVTRPGFWADPSPPLGLTPEVPTPYPEFKSHQLCNLGQVLTPFASWGWG